MKNPIRRGAFAGLLCAAVVSAVSLADPTFLGAEWLLRDAFTKAIAPSHQPDPKIIIVGVSEEAVAHLAAAGYGRPPYPRDVYADAVAELRRAGARVIGLDIAFTEEDLVHPDSDRKFAEALEQAPVILGIDSTRLDPGKPPASAGSFAADLWRIAGPRPDEHYLPRLPLALFGGARGIGTLRIASSKSSANIHDYPIADRIDRDLYVPSLALEVYREAKGLPRLGRWIDSREFAAGVLRVPIDDQRAFAIRWHGGKKVRDLSYRMVALDKVLLAALAREEASAVPAAKLAAFESQFRDAIVLIGYTATGLNDLRQTPLSPTSAGVEIHANALDNLLHADFNRDASPWLIFPLLLLIAALFGQGIDGMASQLLAGVVTIAVLAAIAGGGYLALRSGIIIPTVAALAAIALTFVVLTAINLLSEQEHSTMLRATFGRYVSPQILDYILAHPEKVHLGGERRDLTILFSDIRGFTSISEAAEPEEVVEMLNEYLTKMVEILLDHGGTLDKFIGDAVMGFWNAPADDRDHALHSVQCAIAMIEETARIRARWETEGKASLRIGIGINTGDAVAGNIGAEQVWSYTVIGDAVNLASRLEGKNKDYGTEIIISEFTMARIGDAFETVYLDDVKVKGKDKAVKIYEVKGVKHA
ncbi:MAG: adenylate/guanylate cyclase with Chase sensor [Acidobacteria bacterium]|nr:adenylate/guanylate cyclase with Chase sensor [Acidobacteriota bacterium]